jgi:hypothetical protein
MEQINFFYWQCGAGNTYNRLQSDSGSQYSGQRNEAPSLTIVQRFILVPRQFRAGGDEMRSRARYSRGVAAPKPLAIQERSWAIFTAYCYEARTLDEIGRAYQLSSHQVRRIVAEVEAQLGRARGGELSFLELESAVEDLGLSVRTRNTLRSLGCNTVEDVLRLDLSSFVRGMGRKTKEELLTKLKRAGFHHPMLDEQPASEIRILERSLERMQGRIDEALGAVAKEIRLLKQRLRKRVVARGGDKPGASPGAPAPASANDYCGDEN